jgi:CheY-like chemotaxis protein
MESIVRNSSATSEAVSRPLGAALKPTILIAEDHVDSREAMRELLEAFGFEVVEAGNGKQAVTAALEHHPRLILMDVMMPEMDGFQAIKEIRQQPDTSNTPIIALTAMDGARELALHAGANDFVRKPVDIRRLIGLVNGWISRAHN